MRKLLAAAAISTVALTCLSPTAADAASPPGPAGTTPANYTPSIADVSTDGSTETVRQLVECGTTMYAVGKFATIKAVQPAITTVPRNNAFSFSATSGVLTSWDPNVNGQVNSIALSADCSTAYLGGTFTSVGGIAVKNIAKVNISTGAVDTAFAHSASGKVSTLTLSGTHLLVGGYFGSISGSSAHKYLASLDSATGRDDGYVNLNISGNYVYTDQGGRASGTNTTNVYNTELSPDRTKLLAMGDFTSVGGLGRRQIFMLNLGPTAATVDAWYSPEFNQNCYVTEPFWLQAASWSPDASKVYIATTGYKPATNLDPASGVTTGYYTSEPRGGLCDAAASFPSTSSSTLIHDWVNYTGCDSLYATTADTSTVYVGGHQRWLDNPVQCDKNTNATAVVSPGIGGLDPVSGHAFVTATNPYLGRYTRSRGLGADDMITTPEGLWIASDNGTANTASQSCGGKIGHAGICLLPY